jgi:tetratricopeptide (TPR) repeat protein
LRSVLLATLAACVALPGCRRPDDQLTETVTAEDFARVRAGWPDGLAEAIDRANDAFRAGRLEEAREHYVEATRLAPDVPAGWFGLYMVADAQGDVAAADSALSVVRRLAPGASLIEHADTVR